MYVTYADLIQLLIFIVALVGLIYEISKGKKQPPLLRIVTAVAYNSQFIVKGSRFYGFPFFYI